MWQGKNNPNPPLEKPSVNVLIVDDEPETERALSHALSGVQAVIHTAHTACEARKIAGSRPIDVAVVGIQLADGDGLSLTGELRKSYPTLRAIVVTGRRTYHGAIDALHAGASDYLVKPFNPLELGRCLDRAIRALRASPTGVNPGTDSAPESRSPAGALVPTDAEARDRFAQRFRAAVEDELQLEVVLHRYLEIVLHEVGETNAAIFLPSFSGGFTLGGYINYDMERESLEVLLDGVSGDVESTLRDRQGALASGDGAPRTDSWEASTEWLVGRGMLLLPCRHGGELMGGLLLFRDADHPFLCRSVASLEAIAPIFASHLKKVVRIHNRMRNDSMGEAMS